MRKRRIPFQNAAFKMTKTLLFLHCDDEHLYDAHDRAGKSCPECVDLEIPGERLSAAHSRKGSTLPCSLFKRHVQKSFLAVVESHRSAGYVRGNVLICLIDRIDERKET